MILVVVRQTRQTIDIEHHLSAVMVTVLVSNVVFRGFDPRSHQNNIYEIIICDSPSLFKQNSGVRAKTDWLCVRIMCPSGATCLPVD